MDLYRESYLQESTKYKNYEDIHFFLKK